MQIEGSPTVQFTERFKPWQRVGLSILACCGTTLLARITGLSVETIRRGRYELDNDLADRPVDRVRQAGGGRQTVEKKRRPLPPPSKK